MSDQKREDPNPYTEDSGSDDIIKPLSDYDLYLINKYSGDRPQVDIKQDE